MYYYLYCRSYHIFFIRNRRHDRSTLFPYTTLFRSVGEFGPPLDSRVHRHDWSRRVLCREQIQSTDRKSTRLNSSHEWISYAVFCLKKKNNSSNRPNHSFDSERSRTVLT